MDIPNKKLYKHLRAIGHIYSVLDDFQYRYWYDYADIVHNTKFKLKVGFGTRIPEITKTIEQFLASGRSDVLDSLEKICPVSVFELTAIEGVNRKEAFAIYKKYKAKNLAKLYKRAEQGRLPEDLAKRVRLAIESVT